MKKLLPILFLVMALAAVGCAPIPPSTDSAGRPPLPRPPQNSTEAAMAVEAGVIATGIGLTILDIILSTQGHGGRVRSGRIPHPHR